MEVLQGKTYAERARECLRVANVCPEYLKESYLEMAVEYEQLAKKAAEKASSSLSLSTGSLYSAMKDIYDGEPRTEMDIRDLTAALRSGDTIEDAAQHLCRSGTVDEVQG
jgi:hypothetical protein